MKAVYESASTFKKIVEILKDLVKLVNIDLSARGLLIQAMDSSHVALVSLVLREKGFSSYICHKPATIGVSV